MKRSLLPALIVIWITASPFYSDAKAADRLNVIYPSISGLVLGLWVTEEAGLFRKHGLDVNLVYIQSASAVMQAMIGGEAPIALAGGKPVVDIGLEGGDAGFYR